MKRVKVKFTEVREVEKLMEEDYLIVQEGDQWFIIIGRGECRTGGYDIFLKDLTLEDGLLTATIVERNPKPGMMVIMVITYPTRRYRLELKEKPEKITFQQPSGDIIKVIRK